MNFTFGICTYNSSNFILETLESIKYQVITYGRDIEIKLVVCDDCSDDETVAIIKDWLSKNRLFHSTKILQNEVNSGIAKSYAKLLSSIDTEYFLKIDGDDILASRDVFKECFSLDVNECGVFFPIMFNENDGVYFKDDLCACTYYYGNQKHSNKKDLHLIETIKPFITPEVVIARSNYSDDCIDFISKFTMFEDDTSIWYVFKSNKKMKLKFINSPIVLYRVHNKSLSNGKQSIRQILFLDDLHSFKKILFKQENNIMVKFFLLFALYETFLMKHRFSAKNTIFRKIYNCCINRIKSKVESDPNYEDFQNQVNITCNNEKRYLDKILSEVHK